MLSQSGCREERKKKEGGGVSRELSNTKMRHFRTHAYDVSFSFASQKKSNKNGVGEVMIPRFRSFVECYSFYYHILG